MGTKGRTGNKKAIAAANAKKKASYLKALQSYDDSTAAYKAEIKNLNILTKRKGKHSSGKFTDAEHKKNMDDFKDNFWVGLKKRIFMEDGLMRMKKKSEEKEKRGKEKGTKIRSDKGGKNAARHSYDVDPSYTKELIDKKLKPTKPKKPSYVKYVPRKKEKLVKVTPRKIKTTPVKEKEFEPKKVPGYLINRRKKKSKIKKIVSSINAFTGKKVIRKKRKVRNLVTGKNNRIS